MISWTLKTDARCWSSHTSRKVSSAVHTWGQTHFLHLRQTRAEAARRSDSFQKSVCRVDETITNKHRLTSEISGPWAPKQTGIENRKQPKGKRKLCKAALLGMVRHKTKKGSELTMPCHKQACWTRSMKHTNGIYMDIPCSNIRIDSQHKNKFVPSSLPRYC